MSQANTVKAGNYLLQGFKLPRRSHRRHSVEHTRNPPCQKPSLDHLNLWIPSAAWCTYKRDPLRSLDCQMCLNPCINANQEKRKALSEDTIQYKYMDQRWCGECIGNLPYLTSTKMCRCKFNLFPCCRGGQTCET